MSEQYPGGFITKTNPTVDGSTAKGMWTLSQAAGYRKQGLWPTIPGAPTIGTATAGSGNASVAFTAPSDIGSSAITSYTATSSPGGFTGTGASSPVTVSGLTNGTAYTFTVTATNGAGTGPSSSASNSVTPASNFVEEVFSTTLYVGNGAPTTYLTNTIVNNIDLAGKGGMVWCKSRTSTTYQDNMIYDTARGVNNWMMTNTNGPAYTVGTNLEAFNSNGFQLGVSVRQNTASVAYTSWTFRKQPKFFDIVTYTGNGGSQTLSHNLQSTPGCIMVKATNDTENWIVWHNAFTSGQNLQLDTTGGGPYANGYFSTLPTSTQFTVSGGGYVNSSGVTYVAYIFASNAGGFGASGADSVITCGSYTGNGSATGPIINIGYEPQWLMVKKSSGSGNWVMLDTIRGFSNNTDNESYADLAIAEGAGLNLATPQATGFQIQTSTGNFNTSGGTYIYIAIRRPMKTPTDATTVFEPATTSNGTLGASVPVKDVVFNFALATPGWQIVDRLRGIVDGFTSNTVGNTTTNPYLITNSTAAESSASGRVGGLGIARSIGQAGTWYNGDTAVIANGNFDTAYFFQRASSFMDVVCYTGTGSTLVLNHNLTVAPELIIGKRRTGGSYWILGGNFGASTYWYKNAWGANDSSTSSSYSGGLSFGAQPTSTTVTLDNNSALNVSGYDSVLWMWATCAGVSKVGTYTGTGALQTINCGFASGARFVLITRVGVVGNNDTYVWDSARGIISGNDPYLLLDSSAAQVTSTNYIDNTGVGFQVTAAASGTVNVSGGSYIFLAIA
jgi:hypothetical protein